MTSRPAVARGRGGRAPADRADADPPGAHRAPHRGPAACGRLGAAPDRRPASTSTTTRARAPRSARRSRRRMLEDIDILQRTSTLRITRPTPADEVKTVLTVFRQSLVQAVPRFQRAVEAALGDDDPGSARRCPRSSASGPGSAATATATRSSPRRSPARPWRPTPTRRCAVLHDAVDRVARMITVDEESTPPTRRGCATRSPTTPPRTRRLLAEITKDSPREPHRQKLLVVAARLEATRRSGRGWPTRGPDEACSRTSSSCRSPSSRPGTPARRTASCRTSSGCVRDLRLPPRRARGAPALRGAPGRPRRAARPAARRRRTSR